MVVDISSPVFLLRTCSEMRAASKLCPSDLIGPWAGRLKQDSPVPPLFSKAEFLLCVEAIGP